MKRFLSIFFAVILIAFGLCGCVKGRDAFSKDTSSVEESAEQNVGKSNKLSKAVSSAEESTEKNVSEAPETPGMESVLKVFDMKEGNRLYLSKTGSRYVLSMLVDNHIEKIHEDWNISVIKPSPDRSKVIFNDFDFEVTAKVYLYDVEKKQKKQLNLSELPNLRTASYMEWIDYRYFLFVVQLDQGSVVKGGELYVYDTETDKYRKIIQGENESTQISTFDVYDRFILITCAVLDEALEKAEKEFYLLPMNEIMDAINKEKEITLKSKNAFS